MSLSPIYTITGTPIAVDSDPNTSAPGMARKFSPPTLAVGPNQLFVYRADGGGGTFIVQLWYHDTVNSLWIACGEVNLSDEKAMAIFGLTIGTTAEMFLQVVNAGGLSVTKCAYGFGIGGVGIL